MPRRRWLATGLLCVLGSLVTACSDRGSSAELPSARDTLLEAAKRLSRTLSEQQLTEAGRRGERVLAELGPEERDALGQDWIRFRVDRPVIVEVAAPAAALPFWLADRGFSTTGDRLRSTAGTFLVYRKSFPAGPIGLGVNALDRSSPAHYAVFVHSQEPRQPIVVGDLRPTTCRIVTAGETTSPYVDVHRPFEGLPSRLRGATVIQVEEDQKHATLLVKGRAWKTHAPSALRPDQIVVSFGEDAATSLTWSWRTDVRTEQTALLLAPAGQGGEPEDPRQIQLIRGDSARIDCAAVVNDPVILRHRVAASGLQPDTVYAYALGYGPNPDWARWRTVRTGPRRSRDFSFLYLGDPQTGLEAWGRLIEGAYRRRPDLGFVMIAGDLVDRGNERTNWDHFFLRAARVFDRLPLMPCVGNHEYLDKGPQLYRSFFALPENGPAGIDRNLVYAFEHGGAAFAVLDSTLGVTDPRLARLQAEWLDATFARSKADWKFVMFHHPVYASHPSRESPSLGDAWVPLFDRHRVDLVLQGHDHAYLRTYPMRGGRRAEPHEQGTVYVVSVSGDKFYDQAPREYVQKGLTHVSTYQTIDVRGELLTYRAFDDLGREVDSFTRDKAGRSRPSPNLARANRGDAASR
jgi:3',5'-cyclic AMP phosphodiesterase CpdA